MSYSRTNLLQVFQPEAFLVVHHREGGPPRPGLPERCHPVGRVRARSGPRAGHARVPGGSVLRRLPPGAAGHRGDDAKPGRPRARGGANPARGEVRRRGSRRLPKPSFKHGATRGVDIDVGAVRQAPQESASGKWGRPVSPSCSRSRLGPDSSRTAPSPGEDKPQRAQAPSTLPVSVPACTGTLLRSSTLPHVCGSVDNVFSSH